MFIKNCHIMVFGSSNYKEFVACIKLKQKKCYVSLSFLVREQLKDLTKQYDKSENDLKALQSVGQIVGEVLKQLTEEKCKCY